MKPSPASASLASCGLCLVALLAAPTAAAQDVAARPPLVTAEQVAERLREGWWVADRDETPARNFVLYQQAVEGSRYDRYRMEAVVSEPLARVVEALQIKHADDRYLGEGRTTTVVRDSNGNSLEHLFIDAPFVADRDVILRSTHGYRADGSYRAEWIAANDEGPPVVEGVVRMPRSEGFWLFEALSESATLVTYEQFADLGGSVPAWLVEANMDDEILRELSTLRDILEAQMPTVSASPDGGPSHAAAD